jgi:acyl-ACP thioesterase
MEELHSQTYTVRNYEVGPHQVAHVRTLLDYLQETADSHIRLLGASVQDLMEKGYLWVLAAYHLRVDRYPAAGEEVTIRTWYPGRQERFYLRDFEVEGADGSPLAAATTSWALIDIENKRPVTGGDGLPQLPVVDKRAINWDFQSLPKGDAPERGEPFTVPASSLDMYRHANHVFYIQWALDSVSPGIESGILPVSVEASFRASVLSGDRLVVTVQPAEEAHTYLHSILRGGDGREVTRLRTRWKKSAPGA